MRVLERISCINFVEKDEYAALFADKNKFFCFLKKSLYEYFFWKFFHFLIF